MPAGEVRIVYPLSGARFVVDPDAPRELQRLEVRVVAPPATRQVVLRVDDREVARVGPPFVVLWPLEGGAHEMIALADGVTSVGVTIHVRNDAAARE